VNNKQKSKWNEKGVTNLSYLKIRLTINKAQIKVSLPCYMCLTLRQIHDDIPKKYYVYRQLKHAVMSSTRDTKTFYLRLLQTIKLHFCLSLQ
jgi:hypothetical protein